MRRLEALFGGSSGDHRVCLGRGQPIVPANQLISCGNLWNRWRMSNFIPRGVENNGREPVVDPAYLSALVSRIRVIAYGCFDLRAAERLRVMADEIVQTIAATPNILTQSKTRGDSSEAT